MSNLAAPPVSRTTAEESVGPPPAPSTSLQDAANYHSGTEALEAGGQCSSALIHKFPRMSFSPQDIMHSHQNVTSAASSLLVHLFIA